jgi:hypothetical protein
VPRCTGRQCVIARLIGGRSWLSGSSVVCPTANTCARPIGTGKPGVIGIHSGILVSDFPAAIPFGFALQLSTKPFAAVPVRVRLLTPTDSELMKIDGNQRANENGDVFVQFSVALTVPSAGRYFVEISSGDVKLPSQSIRILTRPPHETGSGKPN